MDPVFNLACLFYLSQHMRRAKFFSERRAIDFCGYAAAVGYTHLLSPLAQRHKREREWTRNNSSEAVSNKSITLIVLPQRRSLALPHSETCSIKHEMKYSAFMNKSLTITNTAETLKHNERMNMTLECGDSVDAKLFLSISLVCHLHTGLWRVSSFLFTCRISDK